MKLVFIVGDIAVGKMTVGQELTKITDLRLFHNHVTIEPVIEVFGDYNSKVVSRLREVFFEEFASSGKYGLIFTFVWAFNLQADWDYIEHVKSIFTQRDKTAEFYFVELFSDKETRLKRNITENRLLNKASKNDVEKSNKNLLNFADKYRCNSFEGEVPYQNYIKIDNSKLDAKAVAEQIKEHFKL